MCNGLPLRQIFNFLEELETELGSLEMESAFNLLALQSVRGIEIDPDQVSDDEFFVALSTVALGAIDPQKLMEMLSSPNPGQAYFYPSVIHKRAICFVDRHKKNLL